MALLKTSSFAENAVKLRHNNRQEEMMLGKKISLMRTIQRQSTNNLGLDSKMIAKRLKDNLERSAQTEAKIGKIKSGMPASASKHYKEEKFGMLQALKEVWNEDDSTGKIQAFANEVTLPAAIKLLHSNGFEVEKHVTEKLDDMRRSQMRLQKSCTTSNKSRKQITQASRRRSSLPDQNNSSLATKRNGRKPEDYEYPDVAVMLVSRNQINQNRKHARHRHSSTSSTSTSSTGVTKRKVQRMRSQTQPDIFAGTRQNKKIPTAKEILQYRPTSAPNNDPDERIVSSKKITVKESTVAWVQSASPPCDILHECDEAPPQNAANNRTIDRRKTQKESVVNNIKTSNNFPQTRKEKPSPSLEDEDFRIYVDEKTETQCPLEELHNKIHTCMEDITLVDLHRASVATKNYPRRMKTFVRDIKNYKLSETDAGGGIINDYYSFRMQHEIGTATRDGTGRRAKSAKNQSHFMVTSHLSSASCCSSDTDGSEIEIKDEHEYYSNTKQSLVNCRNRSLTMKTLSTVWGPSEFIEFVS